MADQVQVVTGYGAVRELLSDERLAVGGAGAAGQVGTVAWLQGSVSRFANGEEHDRRLAAVLAEMDRLEAASLREGARLLAGDLLAVAAADAGDDDDARIEVMALLARRVPLETLARALGLSDPAGAAAAAAAVAPAYFPGSPPEAVPAADAGVAALLELCGAAGGAGGEAAELDRAVACIALLVQTCDATAGLVGNALHVLQDAGAAGDGWATDDLLAEVLRHRSPLRRMRRVAAAAVPELGLEPGDPVALDIDAANRDPEVFTRPEEFEPGREQRPSLSFGHGLRPCPGQAEATALAAGVVDAVRESCRFLPGQEVELEPSPALRIPARFYVAPVPAG